LFIPGARRRDSFGSKLYSDDLKSYEGLGENITHQAIDHRVFLEVQKFRGMNMSCPKVTLYLFTLARKLHPPLWR
jgi:hypothetical protein